MYGWRIVQVGHKYFPRWRLQLHWQCWDVSRNGEGRFLWLQRWEFRQVFQRNRALWSWAQQSRQNGDLLHDSHVRAHTSEVVFTRVRLLQTLKQWVGENEWESTSFTFLVEFFEFVDRCCGTVEACQFESLFFAWQWHQSRHFPVVSPSLPTLHVVKAQNVIAGGLFVVFYAGPSLQKVVNNQD
jgi:hypothetical protein